MFEIMEIYDLGKYTVSSFSVGICGLSQYEQNTLYYLLKSGRLRAFQKS